MKAYKWITAIACAGLVLTACKKEDDPANNEPGGTPDAAALDNFFSTNLANSTQHFTVDATMGGSIYGAQGTRVYISGGTLLDANNQLVTGNVDVALVEVYDRATMLLLNKPTVGILPNGDHSTLISGGEYYLSITKNGQAVHAPSGVWVSMPTENMDSGGGMALFDGVFQGEAFLWEQVQEEVAIEQDTMGGTWTTSYSILDGEWGWTNVDRFYNDPRPKTVLKAKLPEGYNNTNCEVYLAYVGETGALASLDTYTIDGYFSEHYGLIPIGLEVHFIAVTMIDGELHYAIQDATITDDHIEYINTFTPITQAALADLINALP